MLHKCKYYTIKLKMTQSKWHNFPKRYVTPNFQSFFNVASGLRNNAQKMKLSIKDLFSKRDQIWPWLD